MKRLIGSLVLVLSLISGGSTPVYAWDTNLTPLVCGEKKNVVPFKDQESVLVRYDDSSKKNLTIVHFLNEKKLEEHGHSERYHIQGEVKLTFKINSNNVTVISEDCDEEKDREYVPCQTDPFIKYDLKKEAYGVIDHNKNWTEATLVIYHDKNDRVLGKGKATLYPFWTSGRGCSLKFRSDRKDGGVYVTSQRFKKKD